MNLNFKKTFGGILIAFLVFCFFGLFTKNARADVGIKELTLTIGKTFVIYDGSIYTTVGGLSPKLSISAKKVGEAAYLHTGVLTISAAKTFSVKMNLTQGDGKYQYFFYDSATNKLVDGNPFFGSFDTSASDGSPVKISAYGGASASPPSVHTKPATSVNNAEAIVWGDQTNNNMPATVWFKYGENDFDLDEETEKEYVTKDGDFSAKITMYNNTALEPDKKYYYRAYASNQGGTAYGSTIESFTTGKAIVINGNNNIQTSSTEDWYYLLGSGQRSSAFTSEVNCKKVQVADPGAKSDCYTLYKPLAPLPGFDPNGIDPVAGGIVGYLAILFKLIIGIAGVLAVVMIVVGGIQYMTTDLPFGKGEAKNKIVGAIFGLILALSCWVILNTINPDILNGVLNLGIQKGTVSTIGGESSTPFTPTNKANLSALGIMCPSPSPADKSQLVAIAKSFQNKVTYSQTKRNKSDSQTAYFDCSSYVAQVYTCSGLSAPGNTTSDIFGPTKITTISGTKVDGVELAIGDLLGWKKGESVNHPNDGHVIMYIGNGQAIHAHGPSDAQNKGVDIISIDKYKDDIKHIKRIP